jgi:hypothetical protein
VSSFSRILPWVIGAAAVAAAFSAQAQSNLDAGKSSAQIFAATCNACHRSPRELKPTSAGYLRQHYTTGAQEAAAMAAYLAAVGSDARAVQQRRPPTLGAGQAPSPTADQGKQPETQAALPGAAPGRQGQQGQSSQANGLKPRRPSESLEAGKLPVDAGPGHAAETAPAQAAAATPAAPAAPSALEEFEE